MNKQKEFAKISVLIDKLNYLNDNLDYNNFNPNNIDFRLLKKYVDDIQLKLNEISNENETIAEPIVTLSKPVEEIIEPEIIYSPKEQINEELAPHKEIVNEIEKETIINAVPIEVKNESMNFSEATESIENEVSSVSDFTEINNNEVSTEQEVKDVGEELYDLYELNDKDAVNLTKVSDIINDDLINQDSNENIQQDIIATINAIKGGNDISAVAESTKNNLKTEPVVKNLDSIIVDSSNFKHKEPIGNVAQEKEATNGLAFQNDDFDDDSKEKENGKASLNDMFKDEKQNVADAVSTPAIKRNLKDIIDINDRFQFIQSLFGGSYLGFEEAVGTVSRQSNYSEALDYIDQKLKSTYQWDSDSKVVAKFLTLVEKCYDA